MFEKVNWLEEKWRLLKKLIVEKGKVDYQIQTALLKPITTVLVFLTETEWKALMYARIHHTLFMTLSFLYRSNLKPSERETQSRLKGQKQSLVPINK